MICMSDGGFVFFGAFERFLVLCIAWCWKFSLIMESRYGVTALNCFDEYDIGLGFL